MKANTWKLIVYASLFKGGHSRKREGHSRKREFASGIWFPSRANSSLYWWNIVNFQGKQLCQNGFYLPPENGSTLWGNSLILLVCKFFPCRVDTSSEGPPSVAQLDAPSDWRPGRGFNPRRGRQHSFVEIDHEIFSTVILSLPLIQEGQLSVSGGRMCTILVNRLED